MRARDVHAQVGGLLGEPVRWATVKATLAGNFAGPTPDSCGWLADATWRATSGHDGGASGFSWAIRRLREGDDIFRVSRLGLNPDQSELAWP